MKTYSYLKTYSSTRHIRKRPFLIIINNYIKKLLNFGSSLNLKTQCDEQHISNKVIHFII